MINFARHPVADSHRFATAFLLAAALLGNTAPLAAQDIVDIRNLLDLSGLAWVEGDQFLGVHDAKDTKEKRNWPRLSLLTLPESELQGVIWKPLQVEFPGREGQSSDMESACRLPRDEGFLVCESGQEGTDDRRIFHVVLADGKATVKSFTRWPVPIKNVEGTEVCQVGEQLIFLYAERADSQPSTQLRWATLSLDNWKFGPFSQVEFTCPDPRGQGARPIVGMDVDDEGTIYIVAAHDPGSDDGPFRSTAWKIGRIAAGERGTAEVTLTKPQRIATLDGLKVECVSLRKSASGETQIFVGTDDEHYGGILRPLPQKMTR